MSDTSLWPRIRRFALRACLLFFTASIGLVFVFRFVPVPATPLMFIRTGVALTKGEWVGINKDWVSLQEISPSVQTAVLMAEDYYFYQHNGFDFDAIEKAFAYNKKHKAKKGASTISQQTAKNVFLWPSRNWIRKGFEAYFTVLIEAMWPKERIMEVYLNVVELGPGIYGVEAASQKYFKRKAKNLNSAQAALIAAVLPNPNKFRIDKPSKYVISRQRRILSRTGTVAPKREYSWIEFLQKNRSWN